MQFRSIMLPHSCRYFLHFIQFAAMEVCFLDSGETVAVLDANEVEGKTGRAVKHTLASKFGIDSGGSSWQMTRFWLPLKVHRGPPWMMISASRGNDLVLLCST